MDTVFVTGLTLEMVIGVHGWERTAPRTLRLDLELDTDTREAAASDHVRDAVDYQAVSDCVRAVAAAHAPQLLETLAEHIARRVFAEFPIHALRLTVHKPGAVSGVEGVGIRVERRREDYAVCGR